MKILPEDLTHWERILMSAAIGFFAVMAAAFLAVVGLVVLGSGLAPSD
jgi:hypothetical protein